LPLVSLVMETADMFGAGGLYPNATEAGVKPSNEKPCSIEMLLPDGKSAFAVTCAIDLHGNASRNPLKNPKHGFKLAFKGDYGEAELKYGLFPDSSAKSFDDLILRPDFGVSWRHWSDLPNFQMGSLQRTRAARIRDPWFKDTFRDMGQIASHSRFCHLFINVLYWGVYDFTEQPTDSFAKNYFGGQKSDYDVYDQGALKSGTAIAQKATPIFTNGMAQVVPAFQDSTNWVREDLWVETSVDSDRDGKKAQVWLIDSHGGEAWRLTKTPDAAANLAWSALPWALASAGAAFHAACAARTRSAMLSPPSAPDAARASSPTHSASRSAMRAAASRASRFL
jgi:hypothetical protein